jgi:hypothetical protein
MYLTHYVHLVDIKKDAAKMHGAESFKMHCKFIHILGSHKFTKKLQYKIVCSKKL